MHKTTLDKDLVLQIAAKALVINDQGQVLMLRESAAHDTNTKAGKYQIPGGRLDPGEAFLDGLKREAMEETGLEVEPIRPIQVGEWRPTIKGVPHQIVAIFMLCKAEGSEVKISDEHDDYVWIDLENIADHDLMQPDGTIVMQYLSAVQ